MRHRLTIILCFILASTLIFIPTYSAQAATLTVTSTADSGTGTLRTIIGGASAGDTITFDATVFATAKTITLTTGMITISKSMTIQGPGATLVAIDGNNAGRVFTVASGATVSMSGLTIQHGKLTTGSGAGIVNSGNLTVSNSAFSGNSNTNTAASSGGGGIYNWSTLTVSNSTFSGNSVSYGGGGIYNAGTATVSNSTFSGNSATNSGGGLYNSSAGILTISNSTVSGNTTTTVGGGGIYNAHTLNLGSSIIAGNTGGTGTDISGSVASLGNNLIGNTAGTSGFISSDQQNVSPLLNALALNTPGTTQTMSLQTGSPAISNGKCTLSSPASPVTTDQRGITRKSPCDVGAYETAGTPTATPTPTLTNTPTPTATMGYDPVVHNTNDSGTGSLRNALVNAPAGTTITFDPTVFNTAKTITLTSGTLAIGQNLTIQGPGANLVAVDGNNAVTIFSINSGTVNISGLTIQHGNAASGGYGSGGGIYNLSFLTVSNSTLSGNTAFLGGGLYNGGTMTVSNSTLSGNSATYGGGISNSGNMTLNNSTLSGNSADSLGGGIDNNSNSGTMTVSNSTVSGNSAASSGGGIVSFSPLYLGSSIVAGNTGSSSLDISGTVTSLGNNLIGNTSGATGFVSSDQQNVNPLLNALALNAPGTTQTISLQAGSPAIGKGNCNLSSPAVAVTTDQRGVTRKTPCDVGAYESPVTTPTATPTNTLTPTPTATNTPSACDTSSLIKRISLASDGTQGNGWSMTRNNNVVLSGDGRYVVFKSDATNLVSGDTNGARDIFVRDTQTCQTTRVSVDSSGNQANGGSDLPAISATGRYVVFESDATNLVSGDTNGTDIFVHDMQTGQTTLVDVDSSGNQANGGSGAPTISGDGRYVAFESVATNLVNGDTNGQTDIFVHDMQTGQTTRVSVDSNGNQANGSSVNAFISADGQYVGFKSDATNLVSGDTNGVTDIFVHNMQTGQTTRVSVDSNGNQGNAHSLDLALSGDGRYVAFDSLATNLVSGDTNGHQDIFIHDMQTGQTTRVNVDSNGNQANDHSYYPSLSGDGRYIAFASMATNLVSGDTNGITDIFVHDLQTGQTTRVNVDSNGNQGNDHSSYPSLSADGQHIAFMSGATNLVSGDTNGNYDVFVATIATAPSKATLVAPSGTISTTSPVFVWNTAAGAKWYYLWVSGPNGYEFDQWYSSSAVCSGSTCSVMPVSHLNSGTYTFWVMTWGNGITGPLSYGMSFTIAYQTPGAATPISPNGTVSIANPTFIWQTGTNAEWYYLWVSGPNGHVVDQWYNGAAICASGSCSVTPPALNLTNGSYTFWVMTWSNGITGPWSAPMTFTVTGQIPSAPIPIAPIGGITTSNPAFRWTPSVGASWYYLWVSGPSGHIFDQWYNGYSGICSGGTCSVTPSLNLPSGNYIWWIEGWGGDASGTWSIWSSGVNFNVSLSVPASTFQPSAK